MNINFGSKKVIISIIVIFLVGLFVILNNRFGSPFYYLDVLIHPQKYSYNYFMANCTIQDDFSKTDNNSDTVYNDLMKQYKKNQNNSKNLKIINSGFDVYYAILSNNYKWIKPIKVDKNWSKDIQGTISFVDVFVPQNESKFDLYSSIYEKHRIIKVVDKYFEDRNIKAKTNIHNVKFYNPTYDDKYFINMVKDMKTIEQSDDVKEKIAEISKLNSEKSDADEFINATQSYMQTLYSHFKHQYIIKYKGKNGKSYFVKVKSVQYGNREHWNFYVESANDDELSELMGEFAQKMIKVYMKTMLNNLF